MSKSFLLCFSLILCKAYATSNFLGYIYLKGEDLYIPYQNLNLPHNYIVQIKREFPLSHVWKLNTGITLSNRRLQVDSFEVCYSKPQFHARFGLLPLLPVGYAEHANLLSTDYAPAMLSGTFYKKMKNWSIICWLGKMEQIKEPFFSLFSIGRDFSWGSIFVTRVMVFGGEGRPIKLEYLPKWLIGYNPKDPNSPINTNNLFTITYIWRLADNFCIYGESAAEDWHAEATYYPRWTGFVHGLKIGGSLSFCVEYARCNREWYHHLLGAYTQRGQIIGHHMGTDASDLYLRLTYKKNRSLIEVASSYETSGRSTKKTPQYKRRYQLRLEIEPYLIKYIQEWIENKSQRESVFLFGLYF